ncbi:hypothetical protein ACHQM5_015694 [Ranunculus cassubicifolius]
MDGLIPFLLHAIKKPKSRKSFRSEGSSRSRSYHQLMQEPDSFQGSSHRRTRSEFQAPAVEFLEQRSGIELHSRSVQFADSANRLPSRSADTGSSYQTKSLKGNNVYLFR